MKADKLEFLAQFGALVNSQVPTLHLSLHDPSLVFCHLSKPNKPSHMSVILERSSHREEIMYIFDNAGKQEIFFAV